MRSDAEVDGGLFSQSRAVWAVASPAVVPHTQMRFCPTLTPAPPILAKKRPPTSPLHPSA
jgi:hypothetical protein